MLKQTFQSKKRIAKAVVSKIDQRETKHSLPLFLCTRALSLSAFLACLLACLLVLVVVAVVLSLVVVVDRNP